MAKHFICNCLREHQTGSLAGEIRSAVQKAYEMNKQRFIIGKPDVNNFDLVL
jgi:hypothetical protein